MCTRLTPSLSAPQGCFCFRITYVWYWLNALLAARWECSVDRTRGRWEVRSWAARSIVRVRVSALSSAVVHGTCYPLIADDGHSSFSLLSFSFILLIHDTYICHTLDTDILNAPQRFF